MFERIGAVVEIARMRKRVRLATLAAPPSTQIQLSGFRPVAAATLCSRSELRRISPVALNLLDRMLRAGIQIADVSGDLTTENIPNDLLTALEKLNDPNPHIRILALNTIAENNYRAAIPRLIKMLKTEENALVRERIVIAIKDFEDGRKEVMDILFKVVLLDPIERIRAQASQAIKSAGQKTSVIRKLLDFANNLKKSQVYRIRAIEAIGIIGDEIAAPRLIQIAINDPSQQMRQAATVAIIKIGKRDDLVEALTSNLRATVQVDTRRRSATAFMIAATTADLATLRLVRTGDPDKVVQDTVDRTIRALEIPAGASVRKATG